jgi:hypothetical protein
LNFRFVQKTKSDLQTQKKNDNDHTLKGKHLTNYLERRRTKKGQMGGVLSQVSHSKNEHMSRAHL